MNSKNHHVSVYNFVSTGYLQSESISQYIVDQLDSNIINACDVYKENNEKADNIRIIRKIKNRKQLTCTEFETIALDELQLVSFLSYATKKTLSNIFVNADVKFPSDLLDFISCNTKGLETEFNICKLEGKVDSEWKLAENRLLRIIIRSIY